METLTKSNGSQNRFLSAGGIALGLLCLFVASKASQSSPNAEKVYWLGLILIGAGALGVLFAEDVLIEIDSEKNLLLIQRKGFLKSSQQRIPMNLIDGVRVYSFGRAQSPRGYAINLKLKNGQEIKTGKWSFDKEEIHREAVRLSEVFGCELKNPSKEGLQLTLPMQVGLAAVLAVGFYAAWYALSVGPWCAAMWGGNAPVLIIGGSFISLFLTFHFSSRATRKIQ